ncbi:MAG: quinol:electron acceptor oxidoreductase subunit ActD, partial [Planctomycetota bacterium]
MSDSHGATKTWGVLAQFPGADELLDAVEHVRDEGYTSLEAYTPFPVDGLDERLHLKRSPMP